MEEVYNRLDQFTRPLVLYGTPVLYKSVMLKEDAPCLLLGMIRSAPWRW